MKMSEEEIINIIKDEIKDNKEIGDLLRKGESKDNCYQTAKAMQGLLYLYKQEKEKNKELFEEYNKRVNTIIKYEQGIKYFVDETNITDIEPWSTYKINGRLLFDLNKLLEEE